MTGIATLTGRLSAAVGTTLAAEKTRLPYSGSPPDASIMPLFGSRTTDIAPDDGEPGVEPILHRFAVPAISRIASPCQLPASLPVPPVHARKGAVRHKNSSREAEIDDGRLSDIYRSCFQCLTLVNIVSTVNDWCTNVCHVYYNTVCVAGIMQRDIPF